MMSKEDTEFDAQMKVMERIGLLKGQLRGYERLNETQADTLRTLRKDREAMLVRAVAAETELSVLQKAMNQIERIKL